MFNMRTIIVCLLVASFMGSALSVTDAQRAKAASWIRTKVGGCYSQANRHGPCYDCSSLVWHAYAQAGFSGLPPTTHGYPSSGAVTRLSSTATSNLKAGDILYKSGHVGMYIGGGQVVNAQNPSVGIKQHSIDSYRTWGFTAVYRVK